MGNNEKPSESPDIGEVTVESHEDIIARLRRSGALVVNGPVGGVDLCPGGIFADSPHQLLNRKPHTAENRDLWYD